MLRISLLYASFLAHAAPAATAVSFPEYFCRPAERILGGTKGCQDNRVFVDEAENCLAKLEGEVDRVSSGLGDALAPAGAAGQKGKLSDSMRDFSTAARTLGDLVELTDQVMDEIDEYADYVNLPEDTENDEVNGGDPQAYAEDHPCYGETRDSLDSVLDDLEQMRGELEAAKAEAAAAAGLSAGRSEALDADGTAPAAGKGGKSGAPSSKPKPRPKNGGSDITGTEESRRKEGGR